jgi:hypothetical protein
MCDHRPIKERAVRVSRKHELAVVRQHVRRIKEADLVDIPAAINPERGYQHEGGNEAGECRDRNPVRKRSRVFGGVHFFARLNRWQVKIITVYTAEMRGKPALS